MLLLVPRSLGGGGGHEERRGRQFITASAVGTYSGGEFKRLLQADAFVGTFGDGVGIGRRGARTRGKVEGVRCGATGYQPSTRRRDESDPDDEVAGDTRLEYPPHNGGCLRQLWTQ